ncbi:MAG: rod shape-determining protein MreD [Paludibacteraceae bacterium]|nr:rod shape-determining protein MreD [Paludibacteraceae bacterium]
MKSRLEIFIWFIVLVALQVLFFNHVQINFFINPFPYIFLIVVFPNKVSRIELMLVGFFMGLLIDVLSGSYGIHTIATTLIAYMKPSLLKLTAMPEILDKYAPRFGNMDWSFAWYAGLVTFIHHLVLFSLESFDFSLILFVLLKTIISTILSLAIILLMDKLKT